jgi:hypothetical protein
MIQQSLSEQEIQKQIIDYCTAAGCLVFRMNSGSRNYNNKQAPKGTPDLFIVLNRRCVWIEVKTEKGKVSDIQEKMHTRLINMGQRVIVARSLDDVRGVL